MQQEPKFVGIDISKLTLDICIHQGTANEHYVIDNEPTAIKAFFTPLLALKVKGLHVGMENTGCYNYHLYQVFCELDVIYYVIPPIHLKKSMGLTRGKNDKIDAFRIALFLETNLKNMTAYIPQRPALKQLQLLLTTRSQRVKMKKQVLAAKEHYQYTEDGNNELLELNKELASHIDVQIKAIEKKIQELISTDSKLYKTYQLITSIQGVGKILACNLLVRTGEFGAISNPRKLACYAGVAPFDHRSGTSVRGKSRVSQYADKDLKKLLHLASMSVIRLSGDMRDYYKRKVAEGKNKMCVLNAVRNKIIHRIYAVLRDQRPYQIYLSNNLVMS
jgi:transposase